MKTDKGKTKEQLIGELAEMRQRVAELESLETERKQAEEELRNFKTAADTAVFGLGIGTAEHLTYVNRSFAEMHGYSPDELIGQNYSMFYTKEQLPVINKLRERLSAGGSFIEEEVWHKKKDGTSFPTLMTGHAIRDDEGNPSLIVGTTIDITERRQADEELRQSEERYKAIFELGSDVGEAIIINQDMPGQIAAQPIFNDEWIRITGYSRDELLHMSYFDLIHPAQRDTAINRYRRRLQGEKIRDPLELTVVRKDGTEIPIEALGTLTNFRGQNATIVYARDITKRRQAEEALQLRAYLLNNASDSIIAADLEGNIIYANDTACRARGYTKEEMLEMHLRDTVAPELLSLVPGRIQNIFEKGYFTFESEHKRKDGSTFPVEITSRNIKLGERTVILSSMRDITERKQVEAALTESQELYRAVMELGGRLGEAIVLLQDDERGVGMHVYINDVWCDITGYSREELLDISMADLIHHKDRDAAIARYASRLSGEDIPDLVELSIIRKNGTEIPVEVTYAHSTYKGKSANVGFIREIAERKKTETALRQSEEFNSSVLRNSPNPVMVANSDTSIRYVNPALENLTGYSLDELVGQKVPRPWWPEEMYEKLESDVKIAYRRGFRDLERCFQKKSGERFWVQITATPVIIDGKFHHFIDNWVDITERKRMEEEIIKNRDYLERLNDSLTDMIFEVKLPERTIRYINKAVETVLGYRLEECLGQSIEMIYPSPEVFRELGRRLRKGVERGDEITTSEHELKRKDGGIITVEGRTSYLREAGKVVSAFSVVRDITERKKAEEERRVYA
ncbi:MAG: PAS domain S-box protein, partial [Dehalococcoidales bacterium]